MNIFFRHINGPAVERRCQRLLVFFENIRNRQGDKPDAKIFRQCCRVAFAAWRRKRSRHGNAEDIFGPQCVHGDRRDHRGVNAAAQADENLLKPAFAHVVRRAGQQCLVGVGDFGRWLYVNLALPGDSVKEDEIFFERQRLRGHTPIGGNRHARSVKNQIVVAANLIDVDHGTQLLHRDGAQHLDAQISFIDGVG